MDPLTQAAMERAGKGYEQMRAALGLTEPSMEIRRKYSIPRAIRYATGSKDDHNVEALVSEEYERAGYERRSQKSILMPVWAISRHICRTGMRTLQSYQPTVASSGAELVATNLLADEFASGLRPLSVALRLGAQVHNGLIGDAAIPKQSTTSQSYWLNPSGSPVVSSAVTESEGTFDIATAAPATVGALSTVSRKLLMQTGGLADAVIAQDLARTLATALDVAVLQGSGTSGVPLGIKNTSGVTSSSGASFAYATAIAAAQAVADANGIVNPSAVGWASTPDVAAALMNRHKVASTYSPIWEGAVDAGRMLGDPALSSKNVPSSTAIFGDWSSVLILGWGAAPVEIEVSRFSNFASGDVTYRALMSCNVVIRYASSFAVVTSIT